MQLEIGQVFRLQCQTCRKPKVKMFVVGLLEPLRFFLINSEATDLQLAVPAQFHALAPILLTEHPFLKWDSFVGCNEMFAEYCEADLQVEIASNPSVFLGVISPNGRAAVRNSLTGNRLLPQARIPKLLDAWRDES